MPAKEAAKDEGGSPWEAPALPRQGHRSSAPATVPPGTRLPVLQVGEKEESPRGSPSLSSQYWADPRLPRQARGTGSPKFLNSRWELHMHKGIGAGSA